MAQQDEQKPKGADLAAGIPASDLADGAMLSGHVGDDEVLLVRRNGSIYAVGAHCTHYHGPLAEGLLTGLARPVGGSDAREQFNQSGAGS